MEKRANKRGLSDIVTTVLIILIVFAAVFIVWIAVSKLIGQQNSDSTLLTVSLSIKKDSVLINSSISDLSFVVQRNSGAGNVSAIDVILYGPNGDSCLQKINSSIGELESLNLDINYTRCNFGNLTKIEIYPRIIDFKGVERRGRIGDTYIVSGNEVAATTSPLPPPPPSQTISTPTNFKADSLSWNSINLSWNQVGNAESYIIDNSSDGINFVLLANITSPSTSYLHSGLRMNTLQHYHVRAVNASIGESGNASTSNTTKTLVFPGSGLIAYWTFDNIEGWVIDSAGINNGTAQNGSNTIANGKIGRAGNFDGINDYVTAGGSSLSATTWTLSAWIYPTSSGASFIVDKEVSESVNYELSRNIDGTIEAGFYDGAWKTGDSTKVCSNNAWCHIVGSYDGSTIKVYVNGALNASASYSGSPPTSSQTFYIGRRPAGAYFNGTIDEVRIWNRALTAQEVANIYSNETVGQADPNMNRAGLVSEWHMDEPSWVITDNSSSGNNATFNGGTPNFVTGRDGIGKAISFNGISNNILSNNYVNLVYNNFTIASWIKIPASAGTDMKIVSFSGTTDYPQQTYYSNFRICLAAGCVAGAANIKDNNWHFLVTIGDSTGIYGFVDGNSTSDINRTGLTNSRSSQVRIGSYPDGASYFFNGTIDEVAIWNRSLTQQEISNLYNLQK